MNRFMMLLAMLLASNAAIAQAPVWRVTLAPTLHPLPIGLCGAVHLTIKDPLTGDVPRNPQGYRITMADFDLTVSGTAIAGTRSTPPTSKSAGARTAPAE